MASYSLDDIRAAADAKYSSTDIEVDEKTTARLLNPLRLSKEKREELQGIQDRMDGEGVDQEALLAEAIMIVVDHPAKGKALLKAVGDDLALLAQIFNTYIEGAQVGEASASAA